MNIRKLLSWLVLSAVFQVAAARETTEPDAAQIRNAIGFLESDNPAHRAATYKACRERGEDFRVTYRKMLERARASHARKFTTTVNDLLGERTPAGRMTGAWRAWENSSKTARGFVQTNHEKNKPELDKMDRLFAAAESDWATLRGPRGRNDPAPDDPVLARITDATSALVEISRELAWCLDPDRPFEEPSILELEREFALDTLASEFLAAHAAFTATVSSLKEAHEYNQRQSWADARQKEFARILNERRAVLGLQPLRLNENLSTACRKHSEEMERLGYFSHESPVAENKTFGMRARNAGFEGATGECIYRGDSNPASAERAWWYSCGHRLINYASGPDTLGIGIRNSHWTLNTGSAR